MSRSWRSDLPKYFFLVFHLNFFQFLSFCCARFLSTFLWYLNFAFSVVFEKAIDILWGLSFVWGLIDLFSDVCQSREWSSLRTSTIGNCLLHSKAWFGTFHHFKVFSFNLRFTGYLLEYYWVNRFSIVVTTVR